MHFYDSNGDGRIYTDDGVNLFTWDGEPVAYFANDNVYDFDGRHRGWFVNGCIWDHNGRCLLFAPNASAGPLKPLRSLDSLKSLKSMMPLKGLREMPPMRPMFSNSWSNAFWWQ